MRRWLALGPLVGALAIACASMSESTFESPPGSGEEDASSTPSFPDAGSSDAGLAPRGVVLVHAAAFPAFRLCFENYPDLKPQPDSKIMPNANVVGVEVGSVIRIDPLPRAPGRVFVIDRGEVEATLGEDEPRCGALICDREAGALGDGCLRPGQDYDEITAIQKPLGTDQVELLAIAGCANGIVLSNLGVDSSVCGEGWRPLAGNLSANVLELSPQIASPDLGLPVQLVHLAPMAESARAGGSLEITFGPLGGQGASDQPIAKDPPLFAAARQETVAINRADPAFYGSHGFRIALADPNGADGGFDAGTSIVIEQSLAEIQDLSSPRDVPADYYRATSNYALLLLGDPSIEKTFKDGGANPRYSPRRGLHLLTLPILDPDADAGADSGRDGSIADSAGGGRP